MIRPELAIARLIALTLLALGLAFQGAQAQKDYLAKLRDDAYIKISDAYRPMVSPILFADERKAQPEKPANK